MTPEMIASTIVQLAQYALIAYGIKTLGMFLMHWLDTHPQKFERRTAEEIEIDTERSR